MEILLQCAVWISIESDTGAESISTIYVTCYFFVMSEFSLTTLPSERDISETFDLIDSFPISKAVKHFNMSPEFNPLATYELESS